MCVRGKAVFCACKEGVKRFLSPPPSFPFIISLLSHRLSSSPFFNLCYFNSTKVTRNVINVICIIHKISFTEIVHQCL